jgi:hypothetical protein
MTEERTSLTIDFNLFQGIGIGLIIAGLASLIGILREGIIIIIGVIIIFLAYYSRAEQRAKKLEAKE